MLNDISRLLSHCILEHCAGHLLLCYKSLTYTHDCRTSFMFLFACFFRAPWFCKESECQLPGYRWVSGPELLLLPHYIMHIYCHCCWLFLFTLPLSLSSPAIQIKAVRSGCLCVHSIKSRRINSAAIQLCMHDTQSNDAIESLAHTYCSPMAALVPELLFLIIHCGPVCCCLIVKQVSRPHNLVIAV